MYDQPNIETSQLVYASENFEILNNKLVVHGFVHRNISLIERTNKMQPCIMTYYFNVS
jgi:hypothetical protein